MKRIGGWAAILVLANVVADVVVGSPMMVIPQLLDRFDTDEAAWLTASALLSGAIWSPVLAKAADVHGTRRVLIGALTVASAGALACVVAPSVWFFVVGRLLQGAGFAAVFLTVALVVQICRPHEAMVLVGLVTSSSSLVGIVEPLLMTPIIDRSGDRGVFAVAGMLAIAAAAGVAVCIPESQVRSPGRVDAVGALLLGGGLAGVLGYLSLGSDVGWRSPQMCALLGIGVIALAGCLFRCLHIEDPIIDLRSLTRPVLLTLAALVLAGGAFRCMLHLFGVVGRVPATAGLGYGLGGAAAALFAAANLGIALGGITAGWLARRLGAAATLVGGIIVGTAAAFAMIAGDSVVPVALACATALGAAAGAIGASGYTLAVSSAAPDRQGTVAGLVSVVMALGSVLVTIVGAEILEAARMPDAIVSGAPVSTATGVHVYVATAGALFALAVVPAIVLARGHRTAAMT